MATDFQKCYSNLGLHRTADWGTAQLKYRRLVHEWHPDRHTATERESQKAQSRFIELSSSFNAIRSYHRRFQRMPLLRTNIRSKTPLAGAANSAWAPADKLSSRARQKEKNERLNTRRDRRAPMVLAVGAGVCASVLLLLYTLDKRETEQISAAAQRALKNATPSSFERTPD